MLQFNATAFKEWASVAEILGRGGQTLILRKGGIHEKGKRFDVAHEEFFLFPTYEHQNPKDLKPEAQKILTQVLSQKPAPHVLPIQYYCVVEESFWVSDEETLDRLDPFHCWSPDCIKARYEGGSQKGLFGIIVRLYAFPDALFQENLKRYGGCRSWVELEKAIETTSLAPVLSGKAFQEEKERIVKVSYLSR